MAKSNQIKENEIDGFIFSSIPISKLEEIIRNCIKSQEFKFAQVDSNNEDLIKSDQAARLLHVSEVTLYKWRKAGILPFHRIATRVFFKRSELLEALQKASQRRIR